MGEFFSRRGVQTPFMTDSITVTGLVATTPRHIVTSEGLPVSSFRLASSLRKFDRSRDAWVEYGTNWYTVTSYRLLASNVNSSVQKGDRVIVTGKLRIRDWESGEKHGTNVEIDSEAIGHDLGWGKTVFTRSIQATALSAHGPEDTDEESELEPAAESEQTNELDSSRIPENQLETVSVPF